MLGSRREAFSRSIYNKAEYAEQRRHMLQEWADMVDAWIEGRIHMPKLISDNMAILGREGEPRARNNPPQVQFKKLSI